MAQQTTPTDVPSSTRSADLLFRSPDLSDGGGMWRVARDSRTLDLNSSYTYLVQGLVIIVAVAIDIRKYLAKK